MLLGGFDGREEVEEKVEIRFWTPLMEEIKKNHAKYLSEEWFVGWNNKQQHRRKFGIIKNQKHNLATFKTYKSIECSYYRRAMNALKIYVYKKKQLDNEKWKKKHDMWTFVLKLGLK